jgi:hypothetical protein
VSAPLCSNIGHLKQSIAGMTARLYVNNESEILSEYGIDVTRKLVKKNILLGISAQTCII